MGQHHYYLVLVGYTSPHRGRRRALVKWRGSGNLASKGGTPLMAAAETGAGILLLSSWMTAEQVRLGKLEICLPDWQVSQYEDGSGEIYAVYKGGKYPNPLLRAFIDFLVEKIQGKC